MFSRQSQHLRPTAVLLLLDLVAAHPPQHLGGLLLRGSSPKLIPPCRGKAMLVVLEGFLNCANKKQHSCLDPQPWD